MALEGSLRDFGLADILQLLYFQKKTGILTISSPADRVILYFYEGNIIAAESKKRAEENRFGRILLKKGVINEKDLQEALKEQKKTGTRIGDILARKGLISDDVIRDTYTSQLTETVIQLFSWKEGNYGFRSQEVSLSKELPVSLDTQHLLMEGLRILDEWSLIEGRLTLDTIFRKTGKEDTSITPEEATILSFVDGENDVSMITELSQIDNFEVSKILLSLMDRGIIEPVTVEPVITEPSEMTLQVTKKKDTSVMLLSGMVLLALFISIFMYSVRAPLGNDLISSWLESQKKERVINDVERLRFRAELHKIKTGSYPQRIEDLGTGIDAWGNRYYYNAKDENLLIISPGADGRIGTADDIY